MLKRISGELAIDIDKIFFLEQDDDSPDGEYWDLYIENLVTKIHNFEALRIFELLGENVTHEDRYPKECDCG